jgi:hypothetical protein
MSTTKTNNEQLLNDIQGLQTIEQNLFSSIDNDPNLTPEEQKKTINKINSISQMRINLYKTLGKINNFYQDALQNSQITLQQQKTAIQMVENQLNNAKQKLNFLETEKNNKIRLIEINDYYEQKYAEHSILMKYIILMLIPIIILSLFYNAGLLSNSVFYFLIVFISFIGAIFIVYRMLSIWSHDNMNYQEYDWTFNKKGAPQANNSTSASKSDPWVSSKLNMGTCIGNSCCSPGTLYDNSIHKCVTDSASSGSRGSYGSYGSHQDQQSKTEQFVNNVFTKFSNVYTKPDVVLGNTILPSNF